MIWGFGSPDALPYEVDYWSRTGEPRFCGGTDLVGTRPNPNGESKYICHGNAEFLYGREPDKWNVLYLDLSGLEPEELVDSGNEAYLCNRLLYPWYGSGGEVYADENTCLGDVNFPGQDCDYDPVVMAPKKDDPPLDVDPYWVGEDQSANFGRLSAYYASMGSSWNDGLCIEDNKDNSCYVRVVASANFWNDCEGSRCRRMIGITAYGHVEPALPRDDGKTEINPFTRSHNIWLEELSVEFRGIGKNKLVASCFYDNYDEQTEQFRRDIVFRTCVDSDEFVGPDCKPYP